MNPVVKPHVIRELEGIFWHSARLKEKKDLYLI